jgi:hypothetical protein
VKAKLKDGYKVEIDESSLNDWNFIKLLRKIDKGDTGLIVDVAEKLLGGEEEVDKLADHLAVNGFTPADKMVDALTEIMTSANELKNSEPSPA